MIVGALRCNIRVVLARHKRIEIVDRIPGAERFGISQFLAILFTTVRSTSLAVANVIFLP